MTSVHAYAANSALPDELRALVTRHYGDGPNFPYFLHDFERAYAYAAENPQVRFLPFSAENGHLALIVDARRPEGEAFFGFMEGDEATLAALWEECVRVAKSEGIRRLLGPVNGSAWHQYRAMTETDGSPYFKSELPSLPHYAPFLSARGPETTVGYYSAYRTKFDAILALGVGAKERAEAAGLTVERVDAPGLPELSSVVALSRAIFKDNWGYTELSDAEFAALYGPGKLASSFRRMYFLSHAGKRIGFGSTFNEPGGVMLCKTIGLLPEYQGKGLGNLLAYEMHKDAAEEGIGKIMYALIREGNNIQRFPVEDAVVFRKYATYEFSL